MFNTFLPKGVPLKTMWKKKVDPDRPDVNKVHTLCMLDIYGYKRIRNMEYLQLFHDNNCYSNSP